MHGSIVSIVKKFVEVHHGPEAWSLILERGGYPGLVVSPIQTYPDKAVVELLGCACEILDCPLDDLLEERSFPQSCTSSVRSERSSNLG